MEDLKSYRGEIDRIDAQLIPLLEQRMNVVRKVAAYKKAHQLPVLQSGREQEVLQKAVALLQDKDYAEQAVTFMNAVMKISRDAQKRDIGISQAPLPPAASSVVGFYGAAGSFTEQALVEYFGNDQARLGCPEFEDVCKALQAGDILYGVLPIENSSTGAISQVYDLLGSYGFYILGEKRLHIHQNLVGCPDASLESVRTVYSHAQGIEQCTGFLAQHRSWNLVPYHSTAASARRVAEDRDCSQAAIASNHAAELYGLKILQENIQDNQENSTRFIVIGREMQPEGADKVSLVFSLDNESGTLYHTLRYFADHRINLTKIESRPIPDELWNYLFYLDFEGDLDSQEVQETLEQLTKRAKYYRLLGAYRSDK
ncbi:MAG: prephenate dehydratase [Anaerotruncus sp.]|nr:prephenate dehydratase [Anaerotruncus sp.]